MRPVSCHHDHVCRRPRAIWRPSLLATLLWYWGFDMLSNIYRYATFYGLRPPSRTPGPAWDCQPQSRPLALVGTHCHWRPGNLRMVMDAITRALAPAQSSHPPLRVSKMSLSWEQPVHLSAQIPGLGKDTSAMKATAVTEEEQGCPSTMVVREWLVTASTDKADSPSRRRRKTYSQNYWSTHCLLRRVSSRLRTYGGPSHGGICLMDVDSVAQCSHVGVDVVVRMVVGQHNKRAAFRGQGGSHTICPHTRRGISRRVSRVMSLKICLWLLSACECSGMLQSPRPPLISLVGLCLLISNLISLYHR